jgi:hypothetical protein
MKDEGETKDRRAETGKGGVGAAGGCGGKVRRCEGGKVKEREFRQAAAFGGPVGEP